MSNFAEQRLISHTALPEDMVNIIHKISEQIKQKGDLEHVTVQRQLELLDEMGKFDFGCFLLQNQGVNGYWTHYMLTHPWFGKETGKNNRKEPLSELESFLLERAPSMLATQQRFEIFLQENQKAVKNNAKLACIPCGMMGELLYLDFKGVNNIELIGIDYDPNALEDARKLAEKQKISQFIKLMHADAWQLNISDEFDLISSNGLNIYEPDNNKVTELYRLFYKALKPNGKLVTSYLTYPPVLTEQCEWIMPQINQADLLLQRIIFADIITAKWQCFRSTQQTKQQLEAAGFSNVQFVYDQAHIFPTVIAIK